MNNDSAPAGVPGRDSPSLSSVGTDEGALILKAMDAAEQVEDNPPLLPPGGAPAANPSGGECASPGNVSGVSNPSSDITALGQNMLSVLSDPKNKITCAVRERVMDIYFDMQRRFMLLSEEKSCAEGRIVELRSQLDSLHFGPPCVPMHLDGRSSSFADVVSHSSVATRCEGVELWRSTAVAASMESQEFQHELQIRLLAYSATPVRDIATLLKSTFNLTEIGVGPVTCKPSCVGLRFCRLIGWIWRI